MDNITVKRINKIANKFKWKNIDHQKNIYMLSYHKIYNNNYSRINVYYSKMTVSTCINHPKKGKTQLFRRNVSIDLLEKIFENPRIHTNMGYYKK